MIKTIRTFSQQLTEPAFDDAAELVSWMGAVQAQDYAMSKWAVGIRLQNPSLQNVEKALEEARIIRMHILRPTWHYVAAEDVRRMIPLSAKKLKSACISWGRLNDIDDTTIHKAYDLIGKMLAGNNHLSKQEIIENFYQSGITSDESHVVCFIMLAETEGMICSGIEKNKKHTYALLDERVPQKTDIQKEESLAIIAQKYFRSHSPASLKDFIWWSGLSVTEAKLGIKIIEKELVQIDQAGETLYLHITRQDDCAIKDVVHLLPSYDEYLISYKDRTHAITAEHQRKAYSNNGLFHPVIYHDGKIIGNWKKAQKKTQLTIETSFFEKNTKVKKQLIDQATKRYKAFIRD